MADEPDEPRDDEPRAKPRSGRGRQRTPAGSRRARRDGDRDYERDQRDDPRAFALILGLRWVGSAPPTAERYAHALRQWAALPSAIAAVPSSAVLAETPPQIEPSRRGSTAADPDR